MTLICVMVILGMLYDLLVVQDLLKAGQSEGCHSNPANRSTEVKQGAANHAQRHDSEHVHSHNQQPTPGKPTTTSESLFSLIFF